MYLSDAFCIQTIANKEKVIAISFSFVLEQAFRQI
jgi:hypothetical protein